MNPLVGLVHVDLRWVTKNPNQGSLEPMKIQFLTSKEAYYDCCNFKNGPSIGYGKKRSRSKADHAGSRKI